MPLVVTLGNQLMHRPGPSSHRLVYTMCPACVYSFVILDFLCCWASASRTTLAFLSCRRLFAWLRRSWPALSVLVSPRAAAFLPDDFLPIAFLLIPVLGVASALFDHANSAKVPCYDAAERPFSASALTRAMNHRTFVVCVERISDFPERKRQRVPFLVFRVVQLCVEC